MILLHRLSHVSEPFHVNPDHIQTVQDKPDCHVLLTNGTSYAVTETSDEVVALVREWRIDIMARALERQGSFA